MEIISSAQKSESCYFEGKRFDVKKVYAFAENIPEETVPLEQFRAVVSEENESWTGTDGKIIGPYNIVKDWEAAQRNPLWVNHVESIKRVDLNTPILVTFSGHVLDGQHRVVRSFIDGLQEIKIKRLPKELPDSLLL